MMEGWLGNDTVLMTIDITQIWIYLLLIGPLLLYMIATAGVSLSKAGFNSAWSLLLLLPVIQVFVIWIFALKKWPRVGMPKPKEEDNKKDIVS